MGEGARLKPPDIQRQLFQPFFSTKGEAGTGLGLWVSKGIVEKHGGIAPPEARLPAAIVGGIALPVGLFWFAWTNYPTLPWEASVAAGIPFGFGMVLVFLAVMNYLIDAYTIFAASALAANSVLRSCFGAAFPLFTVSQSRNHRHGSSY